MLWSTVSMMALPLTSNSLASHTAVVFVEFTLKPRDLSHVTTTGLSVECWMLSEGTKEKTEETIIACNCYWRFAYLAPCARGWGPRPRDLCQPEESLHHSATLQSYLVLSEITTKPWLWLLAGSSPLRLLPLRRPQCLDLLPKWPCALWLVTYLFTVE